VTVEEWGHEVIEGLEDNSYAKAFGVDGKSLVLQFVSRKMLKFKIFSHYYKVIISGFHNPSIKLIITIVIIITTTAITTTLRLRCEGQWHHDAGARQRFQTRKNEKEKRRIQRRRDLAGL
jgi:hypothetical protein